MKQIFRQSDWDTVSFSKKHWPDGIYSWTYKRNSHPFMWTIFGNDDDGVCPWMNQHQWNPWKWWFRNRCHNIDWYLIGLCNWAQDELPEPSNNEWYKQNCLERKYWIGNNPDAPYVLAWIRRISPAKKSGWRPYIRIQLIPKFWIIPSIQFWWGWKPTRGHYCSSIKRSK